MPAPHTAAQENVEAALPASTTARVPFLSLIEAQRNLVNLRNRHYEAIADYYRRQAALERAVGGPLVPQPPAGCVLSTPGETGPLP